MLKLAIVILLSTFLQTISAKNWKPVYKPFDSLVDKFEYDIEKITSSHIKDMYDIAKKNRDKPALMWRAIYWDAYRNWFFITTYTSDNFNK